MFISILVLLQAATPALELPQAQPYPQQVAEREFTSPISGETFVAPVLLQNVRSLSTDYDHCPHPAVNTLPYQLVIDPVSGYVALPEAFEAPAPWNADEIKSILGEPEFERAAPEEIPWQGAHAWEKYANAAKLAEAAEYPAVEVAGWYQYAAWSVRLDTKYHEGTTTDWVGKMLMQIPSFELDMGDLQTPGELQLAQHIEARLGSGEYVDFSDEEMALLLCWLYRVRGELASAKKALRGAAFGEGTDEALTAIRSELQSSIALEEQYLRETVSWLSKAHIATQPEDPARSGLAFSLGESQRRLGNGAEALEWYAECENSSIGGVNPLLLQHVIGLVEIEQPGPPEIGATE